MIAIAKTHPGKVRLSNQDSYLLREEATCLYAVADGMGGHRGGNVASAMAVEALQRLDLSAQPSPVHLREAVEAANDAIWERQLTDLSLSGMGTTLTVLWAGQDSLLVAHVGDNRLYSFAEGTLHQVTTDHSLVGELLRSGVITPEKARRHPYRNIVTRAVGTDVSVTVDLLELNKIPGMRFLLCSDGLTEYAPPQVLASSLAKDLNTAAQELLDIALSGGGRDNITLIVLEVPV